MSRDTEELEQIRLAMLEVRRSAERMEEASRSLRSVSDLLEALLENGPVDANGLDSYSNTRQYIYESTPLFHVHQDKENRTEETLRADTLDTP